MHFYWKRLSSAGDLEKNLDKILNILKCYQRKNFALKWKPVSSNIINKYSNINRYSNIINKASLF